MFGLDELVPVMPEILILTMACVVLLLDLFMSERRRGLVHAVSVATLLAAIVLTLGPRGSGDAVILNGAFIRDLMGDVLKVFIYLYTIGVFFYAKNYLRQRGLFKGEFYVLCLFGVLGMAIMVSAWNLVTLYLGLELLALCSYALVAMDRDSGTAAEAAMKYFVLGALASGMLLYGMSMIYGATGTLSIQEIGQAVLTMGGDDLVLAFGLTFIVVGVAFKFGAVPFHMWVPDVYEGSPTAVTVFIATAPKNAVFGMAMRLLVDGLGGLQDHWQSMLIVLAVLSLVLGNVAAIAQSNIKRMLAYSTISHVGFILLGIIAGTPEGYAASMFYTITYASMSLGAFGVIILLSRVGFEADRLSDFRGLNRRSPWFAGVMMMLMASLAGIPPFLGFFSKLFVLQVTVNAGLVWLAVVAVIAAVVGAFYYLRVIWLMYFEDAEDTSPLEASLDLRAVLSLNGVAQVVMSVFAGSLFGLCLAAMT